MKRLRTLALASCLTTLLGCATSAPRPAQRLELVSPVNERLRTIAAELRANPVVEDATLCETPGAARAIIHVRWMHYTPPTPKMDEHDMQRARMINYVQRDVYLIINDLRHRSGIDIRAEGREWVNTTKDSAKEYLLHLRRFEEAGIIAPTVPPGKIRTSADVFEELETRYPLDDPAWGTYGFAPGADLLTEIVTREPLLPAQTSTAEFFARVASSRFPPNDKRRADTWEILDGREDAAISLAGDHASAPITAILYGALHQFGGTESCGPTYGTRINGKSYKDNIAAWNRRHPENTFSLLEVTPRTYWDMERHDLR